VFDNPVALIVALVGSAGLGGFIKEVLSSVAKLRSGISAKESSRKRDLVGDRDYADSRAELEARNRRRQEEYSSKLRRILVEEGHERRIPDWPVLEVMPPRSPTNPVKQEPSEEL
jgi:hypothetical protein